jgi:hypothetical protein
MSNRKSIAQWPVIWRVVAPACGSYGHDMVFIETESETEARSHFHGLRCGQWPVRLERVQCGPMPAKSQEKLERMRESNAQNAGATMREIPAYWEVNHV